MTRISYLKKKVNKVHYFENKKSVCFPYNQTIIYPQFLEKNLGSTDWERIRRSKCREWPWTTTRVSSS